MATLEQLIANAAGHHWQPPRIFTARDKIVLYGAGRTGRMVLGRLRRAQIEPAAFADDTPAKIGSTVDGLPVLTPEHAIVQFGADLVFIVTILNPALSFVGARERLRRGGIQRIWSVFELARAYSDVFLPFLNVALPSQILADAARMRRAFALWSDDESRRQFAAHCAFRLWLDFDALPANDHAGYFRADLLSGFDDPLTFVDGGAYDGDTIREFLARGPRRLARLHAFEPDPLNYRRLVGYVDSLESATREKISVHAAALGARPGRMRFEETGDTSASLAESGSTDVQVVTLDEVLAAAESPIYIKLDVEGAEPQALEGAVRVIPRSRPALAISVYHRPDDLWAIPLWMDSLSAGYRLFLRTQGDDGMDVICYAIPDDRSG